MGGCGSSRRVCRAWGCEWYGVVTRDGGWLETRKNNENHGEVVDDDAEVPSTAFVFVALTLLLLLLFFLTSPVLSNFHEILRGR